MAVRSGQFEGLSWLGIVRLGLVQTALGAIVVLTTSTMNRVMVVELQLAAMLPGALVALHYAVQMMRPRLGHGSDVGGRRTPWIIGGMICLAFGGVGGSSAIALMETDLTMGIGLAAFSFLAIGLGVGAAGTSLLVLLAKRTADHRRPAAASIVWIMMIAGFAVTAGTAGHFLDPYSSGRLVLVTAVVCVIAVSVTILAVWGVEGRGKGLEPDRAATPDITESKPTFLEALRDVWGEEKARRFTIFVFVSMLAYSAQELILEPFAGVVFGMTPGESTQLSGMQNGGTLLGMIMVAVCGSVIGGRILGNLAMWTIGGCIASAASLLAITLVGFEGGVTALKVAVFALGFSNGAFAVGAIGSMMRLVGDGRERREGVRMGLWGAAQAIAFGLGGFLGTVSIDLTRQVWSQPEIAYGSVFTAEALMFIVSAYLAVGVARSRAGSALPSGGISIQAAS
jgi:BCD family chlorophyll transporter-like MFS transporter